jgi:fyn-related kinase
VFLHTFFCVEVSDGLCHHLVFPAPRIAPQRPDLCHNTAKNWEIARSELELKRLLGSGNFGEVWQGVCDCVLCLHILMNIPFIHSSLFLLGLWRNCVDVAVKTMKPNAMQKRAFLDEAEIMKKCYHPNLGIVCFIIFN